MVSNDQSSWIICFLKNKVDCIPGGLSLGKATHLHSDWLPQGGGLQMYGRKLHIIHRWSCLFTRVCCTWQYHLSCESLQEKILKTLRVSCLICISVKSVSWLCSSLSFLFINKGTRFTRLYLAHILQRMFPSVWCAYY